LSGVCCNVAERERAFDIAERERAFAIVKCYLMKHFDVYGR